MHIPDGYLGPQTYVTAYGVMIPFWTIALRKVERTLRREQVPLLALGAAFSFVVMMFNVPVPGGTTGHAVGSVLLAILLGPWAAMVAASLALAVQAFMFGDGGITALGANCFNMAVVMPFVGWWAYRILAGPSDASASRRSWAAAIAGYIGLNMAALSASIMFGIQPHVAHDTLGRALYCPYGLSVAVPAMTIEHLTVLGLVEAVATGLVIAIVQRSEPTLLDKAPPTSALIRRSAFGLFALVLVAPLGLYLPLKFGRGDAWGEWSVEDLAARVGYTPERMDRLASLWHAPMPDYSMPGQEAAPLPHLSVAYILSAVLGVAAVTLGAWALRAWLLRSESTETHT